MMTCELFPQLRDRIPPAIVTKMNQGPNPQVGVYSQLLLRNRIPPTNVREMNQGPNPQVGVYSQLPLRDRTPPAIVTEMNQGSNPHEFPRRDRIPPAVVREPIRGSNPHAVNYSRSNPQACLNHENFSLHFARVQVSQTYHTKEDISRDELLYCEAYRV